MRGRWALLVLLGCGARSTAGEAPSAEGVACGPDVCTDDEGCAVCNGAPARCGARPVDAPDFWTLAMLCEDVAEVPTLWCDDAGDCASGQRCEWHGSEAFCDVVPAGGDCDLDVPRTPACRVDEDCPACSLGCYEVSPRLTAGRCEYEL